MKHLIGKSCKLAITLNGESLFYTVEEVTSVSETHISFIDKFGETWSYRLQDVERVNNVK